MDSKSQLYLLNLLSCNHYIELQETPSSLGEESTFKDKPSTEDETLKLNKDFDSKLSTATFAKRAVSDSAFYLLLNFIVKIDNFRCIVTDVIFCPNSF